MAKRQTKTEAKAKARDHFSKRLGSTVRNATAVKALIRKECRHAGIEPSAENMEAIGALMAAYDVRDFEPEPLDDDDDDPAPPGELHGSEAG